DRVQPVEEIAAAEERSLAVHTVVRIRANAVAVLVEGQTGGTPGIVRQRVGQRFLEELILRRRHVEVAQLGLDRVADLLETEVLEVEYARDLGAEDAAHLPDAARMARVQQRQALRRPGGGLDRRARWDPHPPPPL